jgi:PilZ domain
MSEKRKAVRRSFGDEYTSDVIINGKKTTVRVLDVSSTGMRLLTPEFLDPESFLFCKIDIYPDSPPFYVKGSIIRMLRVKGQWELAVRFDSVMIHNFFDIKKK